MDCLHTKRQHFPHTNREHCQWTAHTPRESTAKVPVDCPHTKGQHCQSASGLPTRQGRALPKCQWTVHTPREKPKLCPQAATLTQWLHWIHYLFSSGQSATGLKSLTLVLLTGAPWCANYWQVSGYSSWLHASMSKNVPLNNCWG